MRKKPAKSAKSATARGRTLPKRQFPAHLGSTPEEWRALKRTEWREVTQAMERFNHGSAYVPAYSPFYRMQEFARQVTEAIEADGWIAW